MIPDHIMQVGCDHPVCITSQPVFVLEKSQPVQCLGMTDIIIEAPSDIIEQIQKGLHLVEQWDIIIMIAILQSDGNVRIECIGANHLEAFDRGGKMSILDQGSRGNQFILQVQ